MDSKRCVEMSQPIPAWHVRCSWSSDCDSRSVTAGKNPGEAKDRLPKMNDLKFAVRQFLRNPGFTSVAVLTLALGIGAGTAIFSIVHAAMLRPLPFRDPGQLVWIEEVSPQDRHEPWGGHYLAWKARSQTLQDVGAYDGASMVLTGAGEAERVQVGLASASLFPMLGVAPVPPGRYFSAKEDQPGADRVALLSHSFWWKRFHGDPNVLGRGILLNDTSYTVVGVMPEDFRFFQPSDIWIPLALDSQQELAGDTHFYGSTMARLKPGMELDRVRAELDLLAQEYETTRPGGTPRFADWRPRLVLLRDHFLGDSRRPLWILLGAVALVLLIACANVANLLLARAVTRQKELAIRGALGATGLRLTRQLLGESLLLAGCGGAGGLALASWLIHLFRTLNLAEVMGPVAQVTVIRLDLWVFGFAMLVSILTAFSFGLLPLLRFSPRNFHASLREGARGGRLRGNRLRSALLVGEVAVAIVLLAGAGLLLRSYARLTAVNPGFRPENLLTAQLRLPPRYNEEKRVQFYDQLLDRVAAIPGVESAGATSQLPFTRYNMGGNLRVTDPAAQSGIREIGAPLTAVNASFFPTMGIDLKAGRLFDDGDTRGTVSVAVLSSSLAQKLFPGRDPVGRHLFVAGTGSEETTVIGVVTDIRHEGLDQAVEQVAYLSYRQLARPMMSLALRTKVAPSSLSSSLRAAVSELDPALPVFDVMTMGERLSLSTQAPRFNLTVLGAFAVLALLLAGVGVYGVIAYLVSERTREIGVRMALGARPSDVVTFVLGTGMKLTGIGVVVGVGVALGLTRVMTRLLFEVKTYDPLTFLGIALTLSMVAGFACWLPARRAAKVDPIEALRND